MIKYFEQILVAVISHIICYVYHVIQLNIPFKYSLIDRSLLKRARQNYVDCAVAAARVKSSKCGKTAKDWAGNKDSSSKYNNDSSSSNHNNVNNRQQLSNNCNLQLQLKRQQVQRCVVNNPHLNLSFIINIQLQLQLRNSFSDSILQVQLGISISAFVT